MGYVQNLYRNFKRKIEESVATDKPMLLATSSQQVTAHVSGTFQWLVGNYD